VIRRIERAGLEEAVGMVRRARVVGRPARLFVPLSRPTLADGATVERLVALVAANRPLAQDLMVTLGDADWRMLTEAEGGALRRLVGEGVGVALFGARTLRRDFADLASRGVRYIGVDAGRFLADPGALTDF